MSYPDPCLPPPADPLGETLHMLRLTGTLYCRGEFTAPWSIEIPPLDGLMTFLMVTSGEGWLRAAGGPAYRLVPGALALISPGTPHRVGSDPELPGEPLLELPVEKVSERYEVMRYGGGGAPCGTMYGVVRLDAVAARRLLELLPPVIHIESWENEADLWMQSTLNLVAREAGRLRPGGETVITRLADVIVIQAIRTWLDSAPEADRGWLAALRDGQVGRALAAVHRAPQQDWTVGALAGLAGMSRSAFAARFAALTGMSPLKYVTDWRMGLARLRLQETREPIAAIAEDLGYRSEAAFCRAFRRAFGSPPGQVRRAARAAA
jgi:AraC-like DNA-binding protein